MAAQLGDRALDIATNKVFVDLIVNLVKGKITSYISDQFNYQFGVTSSMRKLEKNLTKLQTVTENSRIRQKKTRKFVAWLNEYKDAIYEAEDVLDTFAYKRLEEEAMRTQKLARKKKGEQNKMHQFLESITCDCDELLKGSIQFLKRMIYCDEDLNDIRKIVSRLDSLLVDASTILELARLPSIRNINSVQFIDEVPEGRRKTSTPDEVKLYGRDECRERILTLLKENSIDDENLCYSILSIVGAGGVGKTTLAQSIFNDDSLEEYFQVKAWVCVSDNFSLQRLMIEIMQSASIDRPLDIQGQGLDSIEKHLIKGLTGKRFLIILDDVWESMGNGKWDALCKSFRYGEQGSKILVTTRMQQVENFVRAEHRIPLAPLELNSYRELFMRCAFGRRNPEEHPELEKIGLKIANKLGGLPLAAKAVGAVLEYELTENHWNNILNSEAWADEEKPVMASLRLSYEHLPPHLQQCFIYCSLFPRNYPFHVIELYSYWAAHGFIEKSIGREKLFELVRKNVDELLTRSFFLPSKGYYVIHGLLHDLARSLAGGEIHRVEDVQSMKGIPNRIRHLFVGDGNLDQILANVPEKRLRSLIYYVSAGNFTLNEASVKKLKNLRMLYIFSNFEERDLKVTSQFIHLRSLTVDSPLRTSGSTEYPQDICKLYQLETLLIPHAQLKGLHKLINLHALIIGDVGKPYLYNILSPKEIGSYVGIQENGCKTSDLQELNKLDGDLHIQIGTSIALEEAKEANLDQKKHIEKLCFTIRSSNQLEEEIFEELRPHQNLKELHIFCSREGVHGATKVPTWIRREYLCNLKYIVLYGCTHLETLPNLGELPYLTVLLLERLPSLKGIGAEFYGASYASFPSLKMILLHFLENLDQWYIPKNEKTLFPRLLEVYIAKCNKLKGPIPLPNPAREFGATVKEKEDIMLPEKSLLKDQDSIKHLLEKIKDNAYTWKPMLVFTVQDIALLIGSHSETFPCLHLFKQLNWRNASDQQLRECLPSLSSLEKLRIYFSNIQSLHQDSLPRSLRTLTLESCAKLKVVDGLTSLSALEELEITFCPNIQALPRLPHFIKQLKIITRSSDITEDPDEMHWFKEDPTWYTVFHIAIRVFDRARYRWEDRLEPRTNKWEEQLDYGPQWENISHIPNIIINGDVPHF